MRKEWRCGSTIKNWMTRSRMNACLTRIRCPLTQQYIFSPYLTIQVHFTATRALQEWGDVQVFWLTFAKLLSGFGALFSPLQFLTQMNFSDHHHQAMA